MESAIRLNEFRHQPATTRTRRLSQLVLAVLAVVLLSTGASEVSAAARGEVDQQLNFLSSRHGKFRSTGGQDDYSLNVSGDSDLGARSGYPPISVWVVFYDNESGTYSNWVYQGKCDANPRARDPYDCTFTGEMHPDWDWMATYYRTSTPVHFNGDVDFYWY